MNELQYPVNHNTITITVYGNTYRLENNENIIEDTKETEIYSHFLKLAEKAPVALNFSGYWSFNTDKNTFRIVYNLYYPDIIKIDTNLKQILTNVISKHVNTNDTVKNEMYFKDDNEHYYAISKIEITE